MMNINNLKINKCEYCLEEMKQIGPFASIKPEGQPAKKWDGKIDYICINENCPNYKTSITIESSSL